MESIFFNERKTMGLDFVKLISDDFLLKDNFEHYENLIDDENVFLEPFLIAHYHQPSRKISQSLNQLLLGFIQNEKQPAEIDVRSDVNGVIYLPRIGYLLTHFPNNKFVLNLSSDPAERKCSLVLEDREVPFEFEALKFVPDTDIEIFRHSHEYIIHKLESDDLITDVYYETEASDVVDKYSKTMNRAFDIIRKVDPVQFDELKELAKKIVFFKADRFVNFTSMDIQGVIFISTYESAKELTFMDTLVHECAHLALNLILINIEECFTVDPYELKYRSPFRTSLRGLYQSMHATYVLSKLVRFYNNCYKAKVFSGVQEFELLGLLLLDMKLLEEALTYIGDRSLYTEDGWEVMVEIQNVYHAIYEERKEVIEKYEVPRGVDNAAVDPRSFEVDAFLEINNLTREVFELVG